MVIETKIHNETNGNQYLKISNPKTTQEEKFIIHEYGLSQPAFEYALDFLTDTISKNFWHINGIKTVIVK